MSTATTSAPAKRRPNWISIAVIGGMHTAGLSAFFVPLTLTSLSLLVVLYVVTALGVTLGFHRLLAHRSFECPRWLKRVLALLGTASLQGGPVWWVRNHRLHHQTSDHDGDPHSPRERLWHGHTGWMLHHTPMLGQAKLTSDLTKDGFILWLDRGINAAVPWLAFGVLCLLVAGLSGLVWGGVVRTLLLWHATWAVNSVCHRWGSHPYKTTDLSGNVWWVGLLALGEGWHNNHHAAPASAFHGVRWWEFDVTGYIIRLLRRAGLVWNVKCHPARMSGPTLK